MAITYNEDGSKKERKGSKLAQSFIGVSGETGPMSKKEYKIFRQHILDTSVDGSAIQKQRLKILKKQKKFGV